MITSMEDSAEIFSELDNLALRVSQKSSWDGGFEAALHSAIDLLFVEPDGAGLTTSLGMYWLHQRGNDLPKLTALFQKAVVDPGEFFLQHNEYNVAVSDVACSSLLHLVPQEERSMFIRPVILRWGPHCRRWSKAPAFEGVPRSTLESIAYGLLESERTAREARERYEQMLSVEKHALGVDFSERWHDLSDRQILEIAQDIMRRNPLRLAQMLSVPKNNLVLGLAWQLKSRHGQNCIDELLSLAPGVSNAAPKKPQKVVKDRPKAVDATSEEESLVALIEHSLQRNKQELFDTQVKRFYEHDFDAFILLYQTELHKLLRRHNGPLAKHIEASLKEKLAERGWRVDKITSRRWWFTRAHLEVTFAGGSVTYLQNRGAPFNPQEGQEVLYCVRNAKSVKTGVFCVNFLELYS